MPTIEESSCPACQAPPGSLRLDVKLVAAPVGTYSLAGVLPKVTARDRPVLTCTACPLDLVGETDGRHVTFNKPPPATALPE
jgi:hypothetical protein